MTAQYIESAELTDLGRRRSNNEDACLRIPEAGVFCVADGMGGAVGGELASDAIVTSMRNVFGNATAAELGSLAGRLDLFALAINQASSWIKHFADEKATRGMGSTVVALVLDPLDASRGVALHAGDSRLYRYRDGALQRLTGDHTVAAALAESLGCAEQSLPVKYQNELFRAIGITERVVLERTPVEIREGDCFLLCSDGLNHMMSDMTLTQILAQRTTDGLATLAQALINGANDAGGNDNTTVVLVKFGVDGERSPNAQPAESTPLSDPAR